MTLDVKTHSDSPAGPSSWVFYRPEWVSIGKKNYYSKVLVLYTARSFLKTEPILKKELGLKIDW